MFFTSRIPKTRPRSTGPQPRDGWNQAVPDRTAVVLAGAVEVSSREVVRHNRAHDPRSGARFRREAEMARLVGGVRTPAFHAADLDGAPAWFATVSMPSPTLTVLVAEDGPLDLPGLGRLDAGLSHSPRCLRKSVMNF
ncbi:hypothetical protein ABZ669_12590 [Streptomyces hirsutus]|uniref:hypothetical protein n=1 Tax=Streptomyces hirsutus TaxID=35620 RepID=UPI0033E76470